MPKPPTDDPTNSTFASRASAREPDPQPRRRLSLRAGIEAEGDFTVTHVSDSEGGGDRVQRITV